MNPEDKIYSREQAYIVDFAFDRSVAAVFPDMIRRSVPGYGEIIGLTGLLAEKYAQAHSRIYDLGCSLGATTLSMARRIQQPGCRIIAVDNSSAMLEKAAKNLEAEALSMTVDLVCKDIQDVEIHDASVVVLNFTLQFIEPAQRLPLLQKIHAGLRPGGVLLLAEKRIFENELSQAFNESLHLAFKRANGYSELEISQKRSALEKVLLPDTLEQHDERLQWAGFQRRETWYQCFNFMALAAFK